MMSAWDLIATKEFWLVVSEPIKTLGAAITAFAAISGAYIANKGLKKWREETLGKRRAELAEQTLANFYRVYDIVRSIRHPTATRSELVVQDGDDPRFPKNSYFNPMSRIRQEEEFLASFKAKKYEYTAVFGKDAAIPFDEVINIINETILDYDSHLRYGGDDYHSLKETRGEQKRIVFRTRIDVIISRLDKAVADIEKTCRPEIEARASLIAKKLPKPSV
jgi:hypothetical protein